MQSYDEEADKPDQMIAMNIYSSSEYGNTSWNSIVTASLEVLPLTLKKITNVDMFGTPR